MKASLLFGSLIAILFLSCNQASQTANVPEQKTGDIDRTILPIREPTPPTYTELDARDAKAPPRFEIKAPQGAPNVVIVLIDDIGFGASSTFGGPCNMPTLDKIASQGLRYNRFQYDGSLFTNTCSTAHRSQSSSQ